MRKYFNMIKKFFSGRPLEVSVIWLEISDRSTGFTLFNVYSEESDYHKALLGVHYYHPKDHRTITFFYLFKHKDFYL